MNNLLNDHSEVASFDKEMEKISPFELKDRLIKLADESIRKMMHTMLNAGRGNPNWVATLPREAFFALGRFGIDECRRDHYEPEGIAGIPQKKGIAERFEEFLKAANKVQAMHRALHSAQDSVPQFSYNDDSLFVKSDYRIVRVPLNSIVYVESMSEYVRIFVEGKPKPIISLLSMKKIEEVLPADVFMRVHRSYIVNLCKIKEVSKMRIIYDGDVSVPVGDMYKDAFYDYIERRFVGKNH